jgi:hypothetical protein
MDGLPSPSGWVFGNLLAGNFLAPPTVLVRRRRAGSGRTLSGIQISLVWKTSTCGCGWQLNSHFVYAPGDVAAIRRHPAASAATPLLCASGVLNVLLACDRRFPR